MAKKGRNVAEIQFPLDLLTYLKQPKANCIMATFSEEGLPHAAPIHVMYLLGKASLLVCMDKNTLTYDYMVWRKKVSLCFIGKNNMVYTVLCRAGVMKAPSNVHPEMNIVRIDVVTVHKERDFLFSIDSGIKAHTVNEVSGEFYEMLLEELESIGRYI